MRLTARTAGPILAVATLSAALLSAALPSASAARSGEYDQGQGQPAASAAATRAVCRAPTRIGQSTGFALGAVTTDLPGFDGAVEHTADLRVLFMHIGATYFDAHAIEANAALGAETVISLHPVDQTMTQVAAGTDDTWLRSFFASDVAAVGQPVVVSFAPEMNGQWYSWGNGKTKPAIFVEAWRHIHDLLAGTHAGPLITWLWQPSAIHFSTPSPLPWWPGSKYVNEVGLDGYYVKPGDNFDVIFAKTIELIRSLTNMPILIGETAVGASTGHQVADIKDLFAGVRRYHLSGLVWFDITQSGNLYHQDWRLQDYPAALAAFTAQLSVTERALRCQDNAPGGE